MAKLSKLARLKISVQRRRRIIFAGRGPFVDQPALPVCKTCSEIPKSAEATGATGISKSIWRRSRLCIFLLLAVRRCRVRFQSAVPITIIRRRRAYKDVPADLHALSRPLAR